MQKPYIPGMTVSSQADTATDQSRPALPAKSARFSDPRPAGDAAGNCRSISILGATGSVGTSTLDLVARSQGALSVMALTANKNVDQLARLALQHNASLAVIGEPDLYRDLKSQLSGSGIAVAAGASGLKEAGAHQADCVMAAIMGAAGLEPTFAAVAQGRRLALANKECLVSAGEVFMDAVQASGTELLPVDSEHSAAFQALEGAQPAGIERIVLTASGGPFRNSTMEELAKATPAQALRHPNWSMGQKITIDSATMMNKGLELIEAYHLFAVRADQLDVIVHPQSIIHCLVEYIDGSVLAQLASPDMRTPIAYALSWPKRMAAPTERLDLVKHASLTFAAPDLKRFPALGVARAALASGGGAPAILNAANEVAVAAFLAGGLGFLEIAQLVGETLDSAAQQNMLRAPASLDEVLALDETGRRLARQLLQRYRK